jgi:hypothetical protein
MNTNLNAARTLAAAGCPVFPCDRATEKPYVQWTECSATDMAALDALWRRYPDALPAIDLGKAGLLVVEVFSDDKSGNGFGSFMQIAATYEWDIDPPIVSAPYDAALHFYFRQPAGEPLASDASLRRYGINIRGKGGYVISPGATRRDGAQWTKAKGMDLREALAEQSVPAMPDWFVALIRRARDLASGTADGARRPLADLFDRPAVAPPDVHQIADQRGGRRREAAGEPDPAVWQRPDLSWLGSRRTPAPAFLLDALGESWGGWCAAHAQARGTPVDFVAGSLLAVTAALIGNRRWPHVSGEWREPPVLWIGLVGAAASGKTPAQEPVLDLLRTVERDAEARLLIGRATPRSLALRLRQHPAGLLLRRDDLSGWLDKLNRHLGDGGEREMWLASHGGRRYRIDRLEDAECMDIPHLTVGILGAVAPDELAPVVDGPSGLCARFLWCWPEPAPGYAPAPAPIDNARQCDALRRILALAMTTRDDDAPAAGRIDLSGAAAEAFDPFVRGMKERAAEGFGGMGEWLGKAPGHCLRLATTLTLLDWSLGPANGEPQAIEREHVERAVRLVESYFLPMARRTFGDAAIPEQELNAMTLARWLRERQSARFNAREARAQIRGRLRAAADMDRACATLVEAGLIRPHLARSGTSKGRLRRDFEVNPAVRGPLDSVPKASIGPIGRSGSA